MIFWAVTNIVTASIACWVVAYVLVRHRSKLHFSERISLGVVAGMMFLRVGPILGKTMQTVTPFDDWSTSLMHVALVVLFVRWAVRLERSSQAY